MGLYSQSWFDSCCYLLSEVQGVENMNARCQVEVVCGERPNHKRENYAGEHDQHFVYWCILILQATEQE